MSTSSQAPGDTLTAPTISSYSSSSVTENVTRAIIATVVPAATTQTPVAATDITTATMVNHSHAPSWSDGLSSSWKLVLGLAAVFGVSVACVYFLIRWVFSRSSSEPYEAVPSARAASEPKHLEVVTQPAFISPATIAPAGVTERNSSSEVTRLLASAAAAPHASTSAAAAPDAQPLSASRARFLEQRKAKAAQQQQGTSSSYGSTQ